MTSRIGIEALDTRPLTYQHDWQAVAAAEARRRVGGDAQRQSSWAAIEPAAADDPQEGWSVAQDRRDSALLRLMIAAVTAVIALATTTLLLA